MQIAESLARGVPLEPMEAVPPAQKVLYFDFELSEKQFAARYCAQSKDGSTRRYHRFPDNFLRAQAAPHDQLPAGYKHLTEFVQYSFTQLLLDTRAKVVIVDNITFLKGANQNAGAAAQLMKALKYLKSYHGLSILVLAHTPKRAFTAPLSINDLQGSNMLSNFADNVFALGAGSQDNDLRYLKHIKHRNTGIRYDASHVVLYRLKKKRSFLQFEFAGYGSEREHLVWSNEDSAARRDKLKAEAKILRALGKNQRQIAVHLALSPSTVCRYMKVFAFFVFGVVSWFFQYVFSVSAILDGQITSIF